MNTRMNREIIASIVARALAATTLPAEKAAILSETTARAKQLWMDSLPPALVALTRKHPASFFCWVTSGWAGEGSTTWSPVEILKSVDPASRPSSYLKFEDPVPTTSDHKFKFAPEQFADLTQRARKWVADRENAADALRGYLSSCNTVEKAVAGMPELQPHVPPTAAKRSAIVVLPSNALSALSKLGFDTGARS